MATVDMAARTFMSTLTSGWRFTLPAAFREARGWEGGTRLLATAGGQLLELREVPAERTAGISQDVHDKAVECYLGSGGKITVPAALRDTLRWVPGKRLRVTEDGDHLSVTPCCGLTRCRSCGSTVNVREVLPNVHLCADCWSKYAIGIRQKRTFPAQRRSF